MSIINEEYARRAKENMSFSDYRQGSATAEFNAHISEVTAKVEAAKARVSEAAQERLDNLLSRYTAKYAAWTNNYNRNGANHVSVMIAGPSNYNMKAHEKYLSREGKLWEEYEELKDIDYKISAIVAGDKIIKSGDENAVEKLEKKIAKLEEHQENMKAANAIIRKKNLTDEEKISQLMELLNCTQTTAAELLKPDFCGRIGFASYQLTNNGATIRTAKQRLEKIKRERARGTEEIIIEPATESETNGIRIVDNVEAARVQIFFPGKPDADTRTKLKKNGFKWAPSIGAWQNYRNGRAMETAKEIAMG